MPYLLTIYSLHLYNLIRMLRNCLLIFFLAFAPISYAQTPCVIDGASISTVPFNQSSSSCGKGNDWAAPLACDNGLNNMEDVVYSFTPAQSGTYTFDFTFPSGGSAVYTAVIRSDCDFAAAPGSCIYTNQGTGLFSTSQFLIANTTYYIKLDGFAPTIPLSPAPCIANYTLNIDLAPGGATCLVSPAPVLPLGTTKITTGQLGALFQAGILPAAPACFDQVTALSSLEKASKPDVFAVIYQPGMVVAISDAFYYMTMELLDATGCNVIDCMSVHCTGATCGQTAAPTYPRGSSTIYKGAPALSLDGRGFTRGQTVLIRTTSYATITPTNLLTDAATTDGNQYYDITLSIKPENNCYTAPKINLCSTYSSSNNFDADAVSRDSESPVACSSFGIENNVFYQFCTPVAADGVTISLSNIRFLNADPIYQTVELSILEGTCGGALTTVFCQTGISSTSDILVSGLNPSSCYWLMLDGANGGRFNLDFKVCSNGPFVKLALNKFNRPCVGDNSGMIDVQVTSGPAGVVPVLTWDTNPVQTGPIATGLSDGTYTLTASVPGMTTTFTKTLISSSKVKIDEVKIAGGNCTANSIQLQVFGPAETINETVAVLNDTINSIKLSNNGATFYFQFDNLRPGKYKLHVYRQDAVGCFYDTLLSIGESLIPDAKLRVIDATCANKKDGIVEIRTVGGAAPYTFNLDGNNPVKADTFLRLTGLQAKKYFFIIFDQNNCRIVRNFEIKSPSKLVTAVTATDTAYCDLANGSISVNTTGSNPPYEFQIDDNGFFSDTDTFNYTHQFVKAGKHLLTVRDRKGCIDTISYKLPSVPLMASKMVKNTPALCEADIGELVKVIDGSFKPYLYQLDNDPTMIPTRDTIRFSGLAPGEHRFKVTDSIGCEYLERFTVRKVSTITAIAEHHTPVNCEQKGATLTIDSVTGGVPPFTYRLAPLYDDFSALNSYNNLMPGTYTFMVAYKDDCIDSSLVVTIPPKIIPTADFNHTPAGKLVLVNNFGELQFSELASADVVAYEWTFGDGDSSTDASPKHVYTLPGTYDIKLKVTNADGCSDEYSEKLLTEDKADIFIPDAFSPNGDGKHDTWELTGINVKDLDVKVYNRWGELVFSTADFDNQWNGKFGNGNDFPEGVYVYLIRAKNLDDVLISRNGLVSLMR